MATLTIRLPDAKHERLKDLARSKRVSVNRLFEEWATIALEQQDALASYELSKSRGDRARGLELLVGLCKVDSGHPSMTWPQAVDEALCCGWIDGVRRRLRSALTTKSALYAH